MLNRDSTKFLHMVDYVSMMSCSLLFILFNDDTTV